MGKPLSQIPFTAKGSVKDRGSTETLGKIEADF